jgi:hypothetical protein
LEKTEGQSTMDNPESQTILGTRHRSKRNKVNNAIQKAVFEVPLYDISFQMCQISGVPMYDKGFQSCQVSGFIV